MNEEITLEQHDEFMRQFQEAYEKEPTQATLGEWCAAYPAFIDDMRDLAARVDILADFTAAADTLEKSAYDAGYVAGYAAACAAVEAALGVNVKRLVLDAAAAEGEREARP